jgi:hypothetical protein
VISIDTGFMSAAPMTDLSVASACSLGLSRSQLIATGWSGASAVRPGGLAGLSPRERNERPEAALAAGAVVAAAKASAYAAVSAKNQKQTQQHHTMWAFRGLEPWSDPA